MSILLDAVMRAKQQEQPLDAIITPRAQYQAMNRTRHLGLKLALFVTLLGLAVLAAWLLSSASPLRQSAFKAPLPERSVTRQPDALALMSSPKVSRSPQANPSPQADVAVGTQPASPNVQLAGKVALPVPIARPMGYQAQPVPISERPNLAQGSRTIAMATEVTDNAAQEPIILGANSNQRGQDLLNSLQAQVDEAAKDVGFSNATNAQARNAPVSRSEPPSDNLLAAFEAALKAVEIDKAVATPVTEPKLDPIPEPGADTLPNYGQLPAGVQLQVPEFTILAHVYASNPDNRWLNVDGAELQQGDMIGGALRIVEIRPRDVVLEVAGTEFKVPAI